MRFAIYTPNFGTYSDPGVMAALAHEAEDAGWDGFFIWDHMFWNWPETQLVGDPWVLLAAMAAATRRITLGPLVTPLPRHRPWNLARQAATLDRFSGGRLVLGVGIGGDWFGAIDRCQGLLESRISNFSLKALSKWAGLVANPRDKKGWPQVFPPGLYLYKALMGVLHAVELNGTGGGAFRSMYAGFLDEASGVLGDPRAREVSERYREIAAQWRELAEAALPNSVTPLREARDLALRKNALFEAKGAGAAPEIEEINRTLEGIQQEVGETFPMTEGQIQELLEDLRERITRIHASELEAVGVLQSLVS